MRDEDRTWEEWLEVKLMASIAAILVLAFAGIMAVLFVMLMATHAS